MHETHMFPGICTGKAEGFSPGAGRLVLTNRRLKSPRLSFRPALQAEWQVPVQASRGPQEVPVLLPALLMPEESR